jgi:hypothetical protein
MCHNFQFSNLDSGYPFKIFGTKAWFIFTLDEMNSNPDPAPDRQALDADPDPDPAK